MSLTHLNQVVGEVMAELVRAKEKHPQPFNSAHEGHSVIREEFEELWDEVTPQQRDIAKMRKEAIQVAAMSVRFVMEVCDREGAQHAQS